MDDALPPELVEAARRVIDENRAKCRRVAVAESCTGGMVSASLTSIAGSSDVFEVGFVTYSNEAKQGLLGVPEDIIETFGAVSVACAWAMAEGALKRSEADVAVAMNSGTQAAKEAGNMVDLDSDPTKLIEVVGLGKQLLMTRGALTTFSVANDVAKYFAIIPAMFIVLYPGLGVLNVMGLTSPESAILSAIIFNALIIPLLVPLALKGVTYRPMGAGPLLARNLAIYGLGGLVAPFIGIKLIDLAVGGLGLV